MKRLPPRPTTMSRVKPPRPTLPPRRTVAPLPRTARISHPHLRIEHPKPPRTRVAHIVDDSESSLVDVLDSLLYKGVMLNAELILALAGVDLVYLRLSALLCAAERVLPVRGR